MNKILPIWSVLIAIALPIRAQQILCVDLPAGVDNEQEEDCGCSEACFADGICTPAGTGSCTEPGTSTNLVYDTESIQLSIPSNTDVEITVTSLDCSGDNSTPGSYLEGNDNFLLETEQGDFDYRQDRHGGAFPSSFGNYVDEIFCYGTGEDSETITVRLTGNRKDECLEISVSSTDNGGIPGSSGFSGSCTVLAAEFISYSVSYEKGMGVWINWAIAAGQEPGTFYIERGPRPDTLSTIGSVNGRMGKAFYEYLDKTPLPGISYYRIRQEDYENSLYTSIAVIVVNPEVGIRVVNPVRNRLSILTTTGKPHSEPELMVFNNLGIRLPLKVYPAGPDHLSANIEHLPPGLYFVRICYGNECTSRSIIKY